MSDQVKKLDIPRRYLVHDEVEEFLNVHGVPHSFRIRIWRADSLTPVVLASQIKDGWSPHIMTCKVANYCNAALLGHGRMGMLYFEDDDGLMGGRRLRQSFFEFFGNADRLRLFKPSTRPGMWSHLEYLVSEEIEH